MDTRTLHLLMFRALGNANHYGDSPVVHIPRMVASAAVNDWWFACDAELALNPPIVIIGRKMAIVAKGRL